MIVGIWDCLTSQDVVNFVRYQVSKGKELTEIGEMLCDHCLAPDTELGVSDIGCDNMTVLIVAITHGRSKNEWYTWIKNRVKKNYGYKTPSTLPQTYPEYRLKAFRELSERHHNSLKKKEADKVRLQRAKSPDQTKGLKGFWALLHSAVSKIWRCLISFLFVFKN